MEKLDALICYLAEERNADIQLKQLSVADKKSVFRALCNTRNAEKASPAFLKLQDEYLQQELAKKGITADIENAKVQDKIYLWQGDITTLKICAIVNAANSNGLGCFVPCHTCIDNQIHTFAGVQLRLACSEIMGNIKHLDTGGVFITKGYNLPAQYIIHTVGPVIYKAVTDKEKMQLRSCYINALKLAKENKIREIAFCCISTGEFKFPKEEACKTAIRAVKDCLAIYAADFDKIVFNVFSAEDYAIYLKNLGVEYGKLSC